MPHVRDAPTRGRSHGTHTPVNDGSHPFALVAILAAPRASPPLGEMDWWQTSEKWSATGIPRPSREQDCDHCGNFFTLYEDGEGGLYCGDCWDEFGWDKCPPQYPPGSPHWTTGPVPDGRCYVTPRCQLHGGLTVPFHTVVSCDSGVS